MHFTGCNYAQYGLISAVHPRKTTGNWAPICVFMEQNCNGNKNVNSQSCTAVQCQFNKKMQENILHK